VLNPGAEGILLSTIKNWFSNLESQRPTHIDPAALKDLRPGHVLKFSPELASSFGVSRFNYRVCGANSYYFGEDKFTSFMLNGADDDTLHVIFALEADEGSYIALSRPMSDAQMRLAFGEMNLKLFLTGAFPGQLRADNTVSGWVVPDYARTLNHENGLFMEDGGQTHNNSYRALLSQPFHYTLYVDETREHAIEIEQYTDGRTRFFATAYLPLSVIEDVRAPYDAAAAKNGAPDDGYELIPYERIEETTEEPAETASEILKLVDSAVAESAAGEPSRKPEEKAVMLEVDAALAGRLIEEADRNDISLADLIRKVANLPRYYHNSVMIPIDLRESDYSQLAQKYALTPQEHHAILQKLIEELAQFAGYEKEEMSK
jgi:hypothetical protein